MRKRNKRIEDRSDCWDQRIGKKRRGDGMRKIKERRMDR
jgi:hypothetical protein